MKTWKLSSLNLKSRHTHKKMPESSTLDEIFNVHAWERVAAFLFSSMNIKLNWFTEKFDIKNETHTANNNNNKNRSKFIYLWWRSHEHLRSVENLWHFLSSVGAFCVCISCHWIFQTYFRCDFDLNAKSIVPLVCSFFALSFCRQNIPLTEYDWDCKKVASSVCSKLSNWFLFSWKSIHFILRLHFNKCESLCLCVYTSTKLFAMNCVFVLYRSAQ